MEIPVALMYSPPPRDSSGFTVPRDFGIALQCVDCGTSAERTIQVFDEPDDPATSHDFYSCGALQKLDEPCTKCGSENWLILGLRYVGRLP